MTKSRTQTPPNAGEDVGQQEHSFTAGGDQNVQPLWKTACWFLMKLNRLLSYNPGIKLLGI